MLLFKNVFIFLFTNVYISKYENLHQRQYRLPGTKKKAQMVYTIVWALDFFSVNFFLLFLKK
jgi:hypothetical protein